MPPPGENLGYRYGLPKHERANADLLERYEWMYGRSMGNRDEVLQRLRDGSARVPVIEYSSALDPAASLSSAGFLSHARLTPEPSLIQDPGRRASALMDTTTGGDITFDMLRYAPLGTSAGWHNMLTSGVQSFHPCL